MAARSGCAYIVNRLRVMIDDTNQATWDNDQLQDILDDRRWHVSHEKLTPVTDRAPGGTVTYTEYFSRWGWFEQTTGEGFDPQAVDPRDVQEYKGYLIQTLLGTGLRISELAALQVSDLEILERKGWLHVRKGKGSKARDIPSLVFPICLSLLFVRDLGFVIS